MLKMLAGLAVFLAPIVAVLSAPSLPSSSSPSLPYYVCSSYGNTQTVDYYGYGRDHSFHFPTQWSLVDQRGYCTDECWPCEPYHLRQQTMMIGYGGTCTISYEDQVRLGLYNVTTKEFHDAPKQLTKIRPIRLHDTVNPFELSGVFESNSPHLFISKYSLCIYPIRHYISIKPVYIPQQRKRLVSSDDDDEKDHERQEKQPVDDTLKPKDDTRPLTTSVGPIEPVVILDPTITPIHAHEPTKEPLDQMQSYEPTKEAIQHIEQTMTPTRPIESTKEPARPVESSVKPTRPFEPTKEPLMPTRPIEPTKEPVEPTKEPVRPVESTVKPTRSYKPTKEPLEPTITPPRPIETTKEPVRPVESTVKPTRPIEPTKEPVRHVESTVKPTRSYEPTKEPLEPTITPTRPIEPTKEHVRPVESTVKSTRPIEPTKEPVEPTIKPTRPYMPVRPVEPTITPTQPIEPIEPTITPTRPFQLKKEPTTSPILILPTRYATMGEVASASYSSPSLPPSSPSSTSTPSTPLPSHTISSETISSQTMTIILMSLLGVLSIVIVLLVILVFCKKDKSTTNLPLDMQRYIEKHKDMLVLRFDQDRPEKVVYPKEIHSPKYIEYNDVANHIAVSWSTLHHLYTAVKASWKLVANDIGMKKYVPPLIEDTVQLLLIYKAFRISDEIMTPDKTYVLTKVVLSNDQPDLMAFVIEEKMVYFRQKFILLAHKDHLTHITVKTNLPDYHVFQNFSYKTFEAFTEHSIHDKILIASRHKKEYDKIDLSEVENGTCDLRRVATLTTQNKKALEYMKEIETIKRGLENTTFKLNY
jgi:hypothetical protein